MALGVAAWVCRSNRWLLPELSLTLVVGGAALAPLLSGALMGMAGSREDAFAIEHGLWAAAIAMLLYVLAAVGLRVPKLCWLAAPLSLAQLWFVGCVHRYLYSPEWEGT